MIGVLTASTTSGSVLGYDLGDLKNKDQKIRILSSEGVFLDARLVDRLNQNWTDESSRKEFKYISRSVANDLAHQFDSQAAMNDRIVRTTGHVSLSFSPADLPKLDDESMVKYAEEYMERMGIVDTQYVITRHFETNAPHLHIAYNRVKYDGTVIDSKNERYRSQKVAAEISEKYDLAVAGDSLRLEESLSLQQQLFSQMRTLAREVLAQSCTMEEFKKNLRDRGISLQVSAHSENQKSYGLSFSMIEHPEVSAKGSKLDRSALSYAKVTATLAQNLANRVEVESQLAAKQEQTKATESREGMEIIKSEIQQLKEQTKPKIAFDFKAAAQRISTPTTTVSHSSNVVKSESRFDLYSLVISAKNKDSLELALLERKAVMEPLKDSFGGVTDFRVTLAAEGRNTKASSLVSEEQLHQILDKWEALTGEKSVYRLEAERADWRKLEDICRKIDAVSPQNSPRTPKSISLLPGKEMEISYTTRNGNIQKLKVDASGILRVNGVILDVNTGKAVRIQEQNRTEKNRGIKMKR